MGFLCSRPADLRSKQVLLTHHDTQWEASGSGRQAAFSQWCLPSSQASAEQGSAQHLLSLRLRASLETEAASAVVASVLKTWTCRMNQLAVRLLSAASPDLRKASLPDLRRTRSEGGCESPRPLRGVAIGLLQGSAGCRGAKTRPQCRKAGERGEWDEGREEREGREGREGGGGRDRGLGLLGGRRRRVRRSRK